MAEHDWKIVKSQALCCTCNAAFANEPHYSVLLEKPEGLTRQDFCADCFTHRRPENVYYFWRVTSTSAEESSARQRPRVDIESVLDFFKRMEGDEAPQKLAFRYILALMLSRKKVLIPEGQRKDSSGAEVLLYREKRGGGSHAVREVILSDDETTAVSAELGLLLGLTPPPSTVAQAAPAEGGSLHQEPVE